MFQQYLQTSLIRVFIFLRKRKAPKYRKLIHTVILTKERERYTLSPSEITLLSTLVKAIHHTESSTSNPEHSKHAVWFQFICRAASSYRLLRFCGFSIVFISPLPCSFILLNQSTYFLHRLCRWTVRPHRLPSHCHQT